MFQRRFCFELQENESCHETKLKVTKKSELSNEERGLCGAKSGKKHVSKIAATAKEDLSLLMMYFRT